MNNECYPGVTFTQIIGYFSAVEVGVCCVGTIRFSNGNRTWFGQKVATVYLEIQLIVSFQIACKQHIELVKKPIFRVR